MMVSLPFLKGRVGVGCTSPEGRTNPLPTSPCEQGEA